MKVLSWFGKAGLFGYANWVAVLGGALLLGSIIAGSYLKGRSDGKGLERAKWERSVKKTIEDRWQAYVEINKEDLELTSKVEDSIQQRREEIDNAKADIPDQGLTDRQRVRACAELRRQGRSCPVFTPPTR